MRSALRRSDSRQLYATDASIYEIHPAGVAFPRSATDASAIIRATVEAGISITPRGAGTSLSGRGYWGRSSDRFLAATTADFRSSTAKRCTSASARAWSCDQLNAFLRPARFLFRAGCGHELAGDARRDDREQFFRRTRAGLRDDRGSRGGARNCPGRWADRAIGAGSDSLGEEKRAIEIDCITPGPPLIANHAPRAAQALAGLRSRTLLSAPDRS